MGGVMGRIELPYVQICMAKGRQYGYYRRGVLRTRIAGQLGTTEFLAAYSKIHTAAEAKVQPVAEIETWPDGLRALWLAYRASAEFKGLGSPTQRAYTGLIEPLLTKWGNDPVAEMTPAWVQRRVDERAEQPSKANHFLAVIRLLLNWAIPRGWLQISPAAKVKRVKHKAKSHRVWTDTEIAKMTGPSAGLIALPVMIALHLGQRLGDVLRLPWSAYDGRTITIPAQGKTGARVVIPALPALRATLDAAGRRAVVICTRQDGAAWKVDHFKHAFAKLRADLDLPPDLHFHGLRHTAGVRLAQSGCSAHEIAAITGHKSLAMVQLYTAQAGQERLASAAITRLTREQKRKATVKLPKTGL